MKIKPFDIILPFFLVFCTTTSCEKPVIDDNENGTENLKPESGKVTLTLSSMSISQSEFGDSESVPATSSRTTHAIKDLCTRISFAVFDSEGNKVKNINQNKSDKSFGSISTTIDKGVYDIVVIAHNGEGNATISSPMKITFKDNKVTDTFYYYDTMTIDENTSSDIILKRAVAMFRLMIKDNTPDNIRSMKFYYTGGSSTFDATTGYGCVNSKQTELRNVPTSAYTGESSYDIYTFPHEGDKKLKIEVSALESASSTKASYSRPFTDVTMKRNYITRCPVNFFGEDPGSGRGFDLTTNDEWGYIDYEY